MSVHTTKASDFVLWKDHGMSSLWCEMFRQTDGTVCGSSFPCQGTCSSAGVETSDTWNSQHRGHTMSLESLPRNSGCHQFAISRRSFQLKHQICPIFWLFPENKWNIPLQEECLGSFRRLRWHWGGSEMFLRCWTLVQVRGGERQKSV